MQSSTVENIRRGSFIFVNQPTQTKPSEITDFLKRLNQFKSYTSKDDYEFKSFLFSFLNSSIFDRFDLYKLTNKNMVNYLTRFAQFKVLSGADRSSALEIYPRELKNNAYLILEGHVEIHSIIEYEEPLTYKQFRSYITQLMDKEKWFEVEKIIYLNRAKFKSITNPLITVLNSFYDMRHERLQKKKSCLEISFCSALKDIDMIIEIENEKIKIEEDRYIKALNEEKKNMVKDEKDSSNALESQSDLIHQYTESNSKSPAIPKTTILEAVDRFILIKSTKLFTLKEKNIFGNTFRFNDVILYSSLFNDMLIKYNKQTLILELDSDSLMSSVGTEINKLYSLEAVFFITNFFFKSYNKENFIRRYFPYVTYHKVNKNETVFKTGESPKYFWFMSHGEVNYEITCSVAELLKIRKFLANINKNEKRTSSFNEGAFITCFKKSSIEFSTKKRFTIHSFTKSNILGLIEVMNEHKYLFNSVVISCSASVYSISKQIMFKYMREDVCLDVLRQRENFHIDLFLNKIETLIKQEYDHQVMMKKQRIQIDDTISTSVNKSKLFYMSVGMNRKEVKKTEKMQTKGFTRFSSGLIFSGRSIINTLNSIQSASHLPNKDQRIDFETATEEIENDGTNTIRSLRNDQLKTSADLHSKLNLNSTHKQPKFTHKKNTTTIGSDIRMGLSRMSKKANSTQSNIILANSHISKLINHSVSSKKVLPKLNIDKEKDKEKDLVSSKDSCMNYKSMILRVREDYKRNKVSFFQAFTHTDETIK